MSYLKALERLKQAERDCLAEFTNEFWTDGMLVTDNQGNPLTKEQVMEKQRRGDE